MMEQSNIVVSVICNTYNHELYIRQCLEGFVMQKASFKFEVLIHDDASTDKTADIIREYEAQYPDIIKPIYQTENQYSKKTGIMKTFQYPRVKGKYIALCEGDDYWIDPLKLQKQVDFMEGHPNHSLCFHAHNNEYSNGKSDAIRRYSTDMIECPMEDIIMGGGGFMATNSMVYKAGIHKSYPEWVKMCPVGDLPLMLLLSTKGSVGYINEIMSCYRISSIGSWSQRMSCDIKKQIDHNSKIKRMWIAFDSYTERRYHWIIVRKILKNDWNLLKTILLHLIKIFK